MNLALFSKWFFKQFFLPIESASRHLGPPCRPPQPPPAPHGGREEHLQLQGLPDDPGPQDAQRPDPRGAVRVRPTGLV